jgi:small subunit ribosomal protein S10
MNAQLIKIKLQSYDLAKLEESAKVICRTAIKTGAVISGPIPMPNRAKIFTIKRSPHVNKEAQDQYKIQEYTRVMFIRTSEGTVSALEKLELSASVHVKIKILSSEPA